MKKLSVIIIALFVVLKMVAQTPLTEAIDFHVKTVEGETIKLFPLLDVENMIVVIDFFSTTCGPCQTYADDFQTAYESFGSNENNVFFVAINYGDNNDGVIAFDSTYGVTLPSVSGLQGGGDNVYIDYEILSYPTVIVITPDHQIVEQHIWPPSAENIIDAVYEAGGIVVGTPEKNKTDDPITVFPNPVREKGFLKIKLESEGELRYQIFDLVGNQILTEQEIQLYKGQNIVEFDTRDLKNGLYFVTYQLENNMRHTARFVVSR